ncbi:ribosome biogenesis GTPase YlqF [Bacillaceae bacterium ZC4]|jgi:ribosome biogenesis GTP-binding protein YlqF|uniref:Ribosome biogenesis GTPase A n=2 Tax=Aeribacillus TaxID=1055323 RepID=A0A161ZRW1_9BACI|nr:MULTISPECIES: ribosome biogenesis GTPase YlqF [Aeribacillus]AXI39860.1 ribosome biogenesis GTPase YlqF [Bacillaceae bacterium ZC4]REJ24045.1 MAG: ribosome biogenesis GTPase YlqF [Bacillaceae bacterium]KZN95687.1 ribosome biogenesis GTPase YlqF [Aeribacillus pallidus]MDR9791868.1 ribosome biogenesis GTPase YlqF [Aeribacillus pallidus]MDR9795403.1 ribosome biogenesis GTPase YlqF [Aeribacillus pallidus]
MTIQWFPGHMAKARRQVVEKLKLIDIVYELVDARIPQSSRNPMIDDIIANKKRILILNKKDMADESITKEWIQYYKEQGIASIAIDSQTGSGLKQIVQLSKELLEKEREKMKAKGVKPRAIRALIVGIPNVGKSTLINRLAGRNIAKTGDRPGITKQQSWIKTGKELELLDTPGILWPKFEDEEVGLKLAATGAIKDEILNLQDVAAYAMRYLIKHYPDRLMDRYQIDNLSNENEIVDLFDHIGKKRGCLSAGGLIDYDKTAEVFIRDVRTLKLGKISFDRPNE